MFDGVAPEFVPQPLLVAAARVYIRKRDQTPRDVGTLPRRAAVARHVGAEETAATEDTSPTRVPPVRHNRIGNPGVRDADRMITDGA